MAEREDESRVDAAIEAIRRRLAEGDDIWCGEGWFPLLADLHADLVAIDPDYVLLEVKEKFGELVFWAYASSAVMDQAAWARFEARVALAQDESRMICELCGQFGRLSIRGYQLQTLCWPHAAADGFEPARDRPPGLWCDE